MGPGAPRRGASTCPRRELLERHRPSWSPDRSQRVILYCAPATAPPAPPTPCSRARLRERRLDRRRASPAGPSRASGDRRVRPHQGPAHALLAAHAAPGGRGRGPAQAAELRRCCCSAPAGSARPSALYLAAAGVGTLGIVDDDVVDESNLQRQVIHYDRARRASRRPSRPRLSIKALNPDVEVVEHNTRLDASQHPRDHRGLRRRRRRRRQLPHPLPAERRLGAAAQAGRLGVDPRLRGADLDLRPVRRPLLPLPLSRPRRRPSSPRAAAPPACSA